MIYRHKHDASLWEGKDDGVSEIVKVHRQGGGFGYDLPRAVFEADMVPVLGNVDMFSPFVASYVTIGDDDEGEPPIPCFLNQQRWNGWRVPYFTKDTVMNMVLRLYLGPDDMGWYEVTSDQFAIHLDCHDEGEFEYAKGQDIVVDGVTHHVYQIGDGWCWDEV